MLLSLKCLIINISINATGHDVGYMPQEYAIHDNLTTKENVVHFAKLNQVPESQIKHRLQEMRGWFDLPDDNELIRNLSGGERRRVSLVCSLIHYPRLVILDEPTAGVDPIVGQKIWHNLVWISKYQKTTVLITTHYIEEARKAHRIGFIRKGRLMTEDSPDQLMARFGKQTLEDTFLHLCRSDQRKDTIKTEEDIIAFKRMRSQSQHRIEELEVLEKPCLKRPSSVKIWAKIFITLVKTNIKVESRDLLSVTLQYIIPLLLMVLAYYGLGASPFDINVGYVNKDRTLQPFRTNPGQEYLNSIGDRVIRKIEYSNISQALSDTQKGKIWGFFVIPSSFSLNSRNRLYNNVSDEAINSSKILVYGDLSHKIVATSVIRSMQNYHLNWAKNQLRSRNISGNKIDPFIMITQPVYGNISLDDFSGYRKYLMPGFMLNCILAVSMAISSISLTALKRSQTLERSRVCGVTTAQLLLAHGLTRMVINFSLITIIVLSSKHFFEPDFPGTTDLAYLLLYLSVVLGTVLGITFAAVLPDVSAALNAISGVYIILLFTTGSLWPLDSVSKSIRPVLRCLPITGSAEAYRSALFRGWHLDHPAVCANVAYDAILTIFLGTVCFYFFSKIK